VLLRKKKKEIEDKKKTLLFVFDRFLFVCAAGNSNMSLLCVFFLLVPFLCGDMARARLVSLSFRGL